MSLFSDALAFLGDPENWSGRTGILALLLSHLWATFLAVVIASVIAIPLGYLVGHTGKGRDLAVGVSGALRSLPTLGIFVFVLIAAAPLLGTGRSAFFAQELALVLLAIPSVLAGAYSGLEAIDRRTVDAARAVGMTELQILRRVEAPLGLPLLIGGLRAAVLQTVATATVGAFALNNNLGNLIFRGVASRDYGQVLAGALLITGLALLLEALFATVQRASVPRGLTAGRRRGTTAKTPGRLAASGT